MSSNPFIDIDDIVLPSIECLRYGTECENIKMCNECLYYEERKENLCE